MALDLRLISPRAWITEDVARGPRYELKQAQGAVSGR